MAARCSSCGMPMQTQADFPLGDETRAYCVHCARPDGTMKSWDEAVAGMTAFIVSTPGLDEAAAGVAARSLLRSRPAWSGR